MSEKKIENIMVGKRVRQAREAAGYTQERLAEILDISSQFISGIERGTVGLSVPVLVDLCDVLQVSCDFILLGQIEETDATGIVSRLKRLPEIHVKNAEDMLDRYLEGSAIAKKEPQPN